MSLSNKTKKYIDSLSYYEMLKLWRFSPVGSDLFIGDTGKYFSDRMFSLKKDVNHVKISKEIGWEK